MKHPILSAINRAIEGNQDTSHRSHLGASVIGGNCSRRIWYGFRWASPVYWEPRMLRLFERGKLEEPRFVEWLTMAGVTVWQTDPATGKQYRFVGYKGHFGGEIDGVGSGIIESPFILEFKTHSSKSFKDVEANGVEFSKPVHYDQMQVYMGAFKLKNALYGAVNKDTDELYFETVPFNEDRSLLMMTKAAEIIDMPEPPARISSNPTWWECKLCEHHPVCHKKVPPLRNCRTCAHSTPVDGAQWVCEENRNAAFPIIPVEVIKTGCAKYSQHPMS